MFLRDGASRGTPGTMQLVWNDQRDISAQKAAVVSYEAAEALCAHGAELDARTDSQCTPLMNAAYRGHPKICAMLLALGADPSLKDRDGKTALDKARERNNPECAALLQPVTPGA